MRIQVLGGFSAQAEQDIVTSFKTRKCVLLQAALTETVDGGDTGFVETAQGELQTCELQCLLFCVERSPLLQPLL